MKYLIFFLLITVLPLKANEINEEITVDVSARSFLHHQVRSIVGCLEKVGCGKWAPEKIQEILLSKERSKCAALAPSNGLYLTKIEY